MTYPDSGREFSLWQWLDTVRIEVPRIQRDYAQGRKEKVILRHRLLESINAALTAGCDDSVKLDFVYGTEIDRGDGGIPRWTVCPLDGQQRLTTLWLVHWYLALRANALSDANVRAKFKRFSYETRMSSRLFCERLVDEWENLRQILSTIGVRTDVRTAILQQTWFSHSWRCDPTIDGMLRTLGGENVEGWKDGIEQWFRHLSDEELRRRWRVLTEATCPITFFYLSLSDLRDPEGLYIKMNARGKPLSPFENFKAELVDFSMTRVQYYLQSGRMPQAKGWELVPQKLDNDWNDIFWVAPEDDSGVSADDRYLAFVQRLVFTALLLKRDADGGFVQRADVQGLGDGTRGTNPFYRLFEGLSKFESFTDYKNLMEDLDSFAVVLDQISALKKRDCDIDVLIKGMAPKWFVEGNNFCRVVPDAGSFLSKEKDDARLLKDGITQPQRVWFAAVRLFLMRNPISQDFPDNPEEFSVWKSQLGAWLRVVANIIENADINTMPMMIQTIRLLYDLSDHVGDIEESLSRPDALTRIRSQASRNQLAEETVKAAFLREATEEQRSRVLAAEAHPCCRGSIWWLFHDGAGQVDWSNFEARLKKLKESFDEQGNSRNGVYGMFVSYWDDKCLMEGCYRGISFKRPAANWKSIFRQMVADDRIQCQLDAFLRNDVAQKSSSPVVQRLVAGLNKIEEYWGPGVEGSGWRVLLNWRVSNGGLQSDDPYAMVLTDYCQRRDPPDNGLFASLEWDETRILEAVRQYAEAHNVSEKTPCDNPSEGVSIADSRSAVRTFAAFAKLEPDEHNTQVKYRRCEQGVLNVRFQSNKPHVAYNFVVPNKDEFVQQYGDELEQWAEERGFRVVKGKGASMGNGVQFKPQNPVDLNRIPCQEIFDQATLIWNEIQTVIR